MDDIARRIVAEIKDLVLEGGEVVYTEYVRKKDRLGAKARKQVEKVEESVDTKKSVAAAYQGWYSRALPVVKQLAPDRYQEFEELYGKGTKEKVRDASTFTIKDYLLGLRVTRAGEDVFDATSVFFLGWSYSSIS